MSDQPLSSQFALITGAASGIGRATAKQLANSGVGGLALVDVDEDALNTVAKDIAAAEVSHVTYTVDVRDANALTNAFGAACDHFGALHYVHNNVGIMSGFPGFPTLAIDKIDRILAVNLRSVIIGTQLAHHLISQSGGGSILNTSSGAGKVPLPTDPVYAATKAAVNHLVRSCRHTFAADGVRINAICPGVVDTAILEQNQHPEYAPQSSQDWLAQQGLALLTPDQIAQQCVELLTDTTRTGECLSVDNQAL